MLPESPEPMKTNQPTHDIAAPAMTENTAQGYVTLPKLQPLVREMTRAKYLVILRHCKNDLERKFYPDVPILQLLVAEVTQLGKGVEFDAFGMPELPRSAHNGRQPSSHRRPRHCEERSDAAVHAPNS